MKENKCILVGMLRGGVWETVFEECRRYYSPDGISPTLPTKGGGYHEVKIGEQEISESLDGEEIQKVVRVRRLTPREYYRLMGFSDEDYEKVAAELSETQLYKTAGNSIVVNVLEGIMRQLKPYFV